MRTGERAAGGFTYLGLMFAIALAAALLAGLGQRWSTVLQRDREAELDFRGRQIVHAIDAYRQASPGAGKVLPRRLEDLVDDRRTDPPRHHLRRLYTDPFTARADWVLVTDEAGGLRGVHSRSTSPALATAGLKPAKEGDIVRVADRVFALPTPGGTP